MQTSSRSGQADQIRGILIGQRQRLFCQDMQSRFHRSRGNLLVCRRNRTIKQGVRSYFINRSPDIAEDRHVQVEFVGSQPGVFLIKIDQSLDLEAQFSRGTKPLGAHRAATDHNSSNGFGVHGLQFAVCSSFLVLVLVLDNASNLRSTTTKPSTANRKPQTANSLVGTGDDQTPPKTVSPPAPKTKDDSNYFFSASGLIFAAASVKPASTVP